MTQKLPFLKNAVLVLSFAFCGVLHAQSPVTVSLDVKNPSTAILPYFMGLSFEATQLLPNADGVHYFRADNQPLINLFRTLGIKNLRIGGNTSDRNAKKLPTEADLDNLFAFAKAADVKVIYCLRLRNGDPSADAKTAKYIMDRYADEMDCFSIGQEPSAYHVGEEPDEHSLAAHKRKVEKFQYPAYAADWKKFADIITAAVPDIKLCGPSVEDNGEWMSKFIEDFGHYNRLALISGHLYPGRAGNKVPTPEIGRDRMLSNDSTATNSFKSVYQKFYDSFVPMATAVHLLYRLEEVNNYFNGGATNVSNTFASALWGLDFSWWWAAHGAVGLNFHTGDKVAAGAALQASKYTAFITAGNGYLVRPLGYGLKAFDLGSHGKMLPVTVANPDSLDISAYAVLSDDKSLCLTIINQEHGAGARGAKISITQNNAGFTRGQVMFLTSSNNDIAATSGETLGGAEIKSDGRWDGRWLDLSAPNAKTNFTVQLRPASAAVVRLTANN